MNDEKFELTICDLAGSGTYYADIADELRARDTAQREALARVEAEHEANRLELGEALILIGQVLDCRTLEDLNPVRRYLNEFMDRYSLRPVPDVDLVQAEQQEAQGAQAGEFQREDRYIVIKRKDFYRLPMEMRLQFSMALRELAPRLPKREYLVVESDWPEYEPTWAAIQARVTGKGAQAGDEPIPHFRFEDRAGNAEWYVRLRDHRAALATQPAAIRLPPSPYFGAEGDHELSKYEQGELQGRCDMWELIRKMNAVRGAEHA